MEKKKRNQNKVIRRKERRKESSKKKLKNVLSFEKQCQIMYIDYISILCIF